MDELIGINSLLYNADDAEELNKLLETSKERDKLLETSKECDKLLETSKECEEEMTQVLRNFKESAKNENKIFMDNVDSEYWVAICFQSRAQKEEWLNKAGLIECGDKYLDGLEVAEKMGIHIEDMTPVVPRFNINKQWEKFIRPDTA